MAESSTTTIEPQQAWKLDLFRPEDAPGVARLFHLVYGDGYPIKTFLEPARLIEANASRRTISIVVRTFKGDIVGHIALIQSAPNQDLYEISAGLVAPAYRREKLGFRLMEHIVTTAAPRFGIVNLFGEPVCNNLVMQKIGAQLEFVVSALEVDLMPVETYTTEASAAGRVATTLFFMIKSPKPQIIYVPEIYKEIIPILYAGIEPGGEFVPSSAALPVRPETVISAQVYNFAQVTRFALHETGLDFATVFDREENAASQQGVTVFQAWLKLSWPWVGHVVDHLRSRGYFIGGVLPGWFETDALLMQKVSGLPHWEGIEVFGERSASILKMVRADWEKTRN